MNDHHSAKNITEYFRMHGCADSPVEKLTDPQLYKRCRQYGTSALRWRWKFAGLLPEVKRRELYLKKGFVSIYEFAARLAGMPREQVTRVVHLDAQLEDKPMLRQMLVEGEISHNKLRRVVSIVTPENEKAVAVQVRQLSQSALATLVNDAKIENQIGLPKPKIDKKPGFAPRSAGGQTDDHDIRLLALGLNDQTIAQFEEFKRKGFDLNALLSELFEKRQAEIELEKQDIVLDQEFKEDLKTLEALWQTSPPEAAGSRGHSADGTAHALAGEPEKKISRYVPVKIRRVIQKEFGSKCAIGHCPREIKNLHHTNRFALGKSHNPFYLAPLCKEHHAIAHSIDITVQEKRGS